MTNVDNLDRLIYDYKQNSIGSAIAGAEQHLPVWQAEVGAFGGEGTAFGKEGKRLDSGTRGNAPLSRGSRSTVPNVTIDLAKINLGFWRDHDAIT